MSKDKCLVLYTKILWCLLHSSSWFIRFPRELGGSLDIHLLYSWILWSIWECCRFPKPSIQAGRENDPYPFLLEQLSDILSLPPHTLLIYFFLLFTLLLLYLYAHVKVGQKRENIGFSAILSQLSPLTLEHLPFIFSDSIRETCQWGEVAISLAAKARKGSDLTVCPMFSLSRQMWQLHHYNPGIV